MVPGVICGGRESGEDEAAEGGVVVRVKEARGLEEENEKVALGKFSDLLVRVL